MGGYKRSRLKKILQAPTAKIRYSVVDSLIPDKLRDGRILDIGCGEYPYFLGRIEFNEKWGVDPMLDIEKYRELVNPALARGSVPELFKYIPLTFDIITIISVIEHFDPSDIPTIFKEIYRILKPGGRFIMTCLNPKVDRLLRLMRWNTEHKLYYDIFDIECMLWDAEFKVWNIHNGSFEFGLNRWLYADREG